MHGFHGFQAFIAAVAVVELACDLVLHMSAHDWRMPFSFHAIFNPASNDTEPILLFSVLRSIVFTVLSILAVTVGTPVFRRQPTPRATQRSPLSADGTSYQPLLQEIRVQEAESGGDEPEELTQAEKTAIKDRAALKKNIVAGVMFLFGTFCQIFTGIKMVNFTFSSPTLQASLMCASLLLINVHLHMSLRLINKMTKDQGFMLEGVHPHTLRYDESGASHWCRRCHVRARKTYRCVACNFDICVKCFEQCMAAKNKAKGAPSQSRDAKVTPQVAAPIAQKVESKEKEEKSEKSNGASERTVSPPGVVTSPDREMSPTIVQALKGKGKEKKKEKKKKLSTMVYMWKSFSMAQSHWPLLTLATVCLLATSAANLLLPNYQGRILDDVVSLADIDEDEDPSMPRTTKSMFLHHIKLLLALSLIVGLFGAVRNLCFSVVSSKMGADIRNKLFRSVIMQEIAFFDTTNSGDLVSRLMNDTFAMMNPMQTALSSLLSSVIMLVGGLLMCVLTSWRLTVLSFTCLGPVIYITSEYSKWSRVVYKEIWGALGEANVVASQAFSNMRTVRAFCCEDYESAKYEERVDESLAKGIKDSVAGAGAFALTNYLQLGTGVLILWYGGSLVMDNTGSLSVGALITFQLYFNMWSNNFQQLQSIINSFTRAAGAAERVLSIIERKPEMALEEGEPADGVRGDLRFDNVEFAYKQRPENTVLQQVNLTIKQGSLCALVGRSGAGKSTLVHLLMRFYDPTAGNVYIGNKNIRDLNLRSLHRIISLVAQDSQLFSASIAENIAYGSEDCTRADIIEAAKQANAHDFIMSFKDGYETEVGERGVQLSGGQKQRIAIARAILKRAPIMFLDEATSSLDTESEALVQSAIDNLLRNRGCTVLLVAHRLSTVINADKIVVVDAGRILEEGTHETLVQKGGVYAALVRRQILRKDQDKLGVASHAAGDLCVDALMDA